MGGKVSILDGPSSPPHRRWPRRAGVPQRAWAVRIRSSCYIPRSTGKPKGPAHTQAGYLAVCCPDAPGKAPPWGDLQEGLGAVGLGGHNCCCVQEQGQKSWHQCGWRGGLAGQCLCLSEGPGSRVPWFPACPQPITCAESFWGLSAALAQLLSGTGCPGHSSLPDPLSPYDCIM